MPLLGRSGCRCDACRGRRRSVSPVDSHLKLRGDRTEILIGTISTNCWAPLLHITLRHETPYYGNTPQSPPAQSPEPRIKPSPQPKCDR